MLRTKRLILRQWTEDDFLPFAALCSDAEVMEFFPNPLTQSESLEMASKIKDLIDSRGWGFWAVEVPGVSQFIGFVGLHKPKDNLPFSPCVEIGWRLAKEHWGYGYAREAAEECLRFAFNELNLDEVVSFTTTTNIRSQKVMQKIGMSNSGENFMHPNVEPSSPLCEHVLYKLSKRTWESRFSPGSL